VTTTVPRRIPATDLLAPITAALRAVPAGRDRPELPGLAPGLVVADAPGWLPATRLVDGSGLSDLLESAGRHWHASPHAAAALAWKYYSYWLALPAAIGWATARRVPLLHPADVLVRVGHDPPLVTLGLRPSTTVAVLPADPQAGTGGLPARVVAGETELLTALRESLLDAHLTPLLRALRARVRVGTRTLLGSVSAGIAHGILRAGDALPGPASGHIATLLGALGVDDLIELVAGPTGEPTVRRKTCCLAFTLPNPKTCTGCCIDPA
jgi:hypothetical protein